MQPSLALVCGVLVGWLGVAVGQRGQMPVLCPQGRRNMEPHPTDCYSYIVCVSGESYEVTRCAPGTIFVPDSDQPCHRTSPALVEACAVRMDQRRQARPRPVVLPPEPTDLSTTFRAADVPVPLVARTGRPVSRAVCGDIEQALNAFLRQLLQTYLASCQSPQCQSSAPRLRVICEEPQDSWLDPSYFTFR